MLTNVAAVVDDHIERAVFRHNVCQHGWVCLAAAFHADSRTRHQLFLHTLVSAGRDGPAAPPGLTPEAGRLYARARLGTQSVAELSAHCGMPLGVTRLLVPLLTRGEITASRSVPSAVLVAVTSDETRALSEAVAQRLRERGVETRIIRRCCHGLSALSARRIRSM